MIVRPLPGQSPPPCTIGSWEAPFDHVVMANIPPPACAIPPNPDVGFPAGWFTAIHMSLIPKGPHQGHVIVWDGHHVQTYHAPAAGQTRVIRYSIFDPVTQQFWNHITCVAANKGDLFCAGHVWNAQGDLVIAGGTESHATFEGATLVYVWQPPTTLGGPGTWLFPYVPGTTTQHFLVVRRWYPSLVMMGPDPFDDMDRVLIAGGTDYVTPTNQPAQTIDRNDYECWEPSALQPIAGQMQSIQGVRKWNGPQLGGFGLSNYSRAHFLSTFRVVTAGMPVGTDRLQHDTAVQGIWLSDSNWLMVGNRSYGSNVLYPITPGGVLRDYVVASGGYDWGTGLILDSVQVSHAAAATPGGRAWVAQPALMHRRWLHNTVLLPDSGILALGGEKQYTGVSCSEVPALVPELFPSGAKSWTELASDTIIRDYHATAVLLPNGKVLVGGGESRHYPPWSNCSNQSQRTASVPTADYRVFIPPNINCGNPRPTILNQAAGGSAWDWFYGQTYGVSYTALPFGVTVQKVTLLRAGSVTHHSDGNQRCVELQFQPVADTDPPLLQVTVPTKQSYLLPRGHYMLFLVTNQGTPSPAAWVQIR
jgi:hypothetical protein